MSIASQLYRLMKRLIPDCLGTNSDQTQQFRNWRVLREYLFPTNRTLYKSFCRDTLDSTSRETFMKDIKPNRLMNRLLIASICMLSLLNCKQDKISPVGLECYSGFEGLSRDENVTDAPVVVQLSGGTAIGSQLIATNGVAWDGCNLPNNLCKIV